jgi:predicted transglutaminase-like cysteine proteinase
LPKPVSDIQQYGLDDYWASPLEMLTSHAGDCEDYAIAKYVALQAAGVAPDDLRLVIVRDLRHQATHAVLAVHQDGEWLLLDNRTLVMVSANSQAGER